MAGDQEIDAQIKMLDIFGRSQAPNAGTINVVYQNNENALEVETMRFDPRMAVHFSSHGALQGRELDTEKLRAAGIENVQSSARYYAFPDFAQAVVQDYNTANRTATQLYNQLTTELGYTDRLSLPQPVTDISQYNDFSGWETMSRMLQGARDSAMKTPGFYEDHIVLMDQITPALENLESAGANARSLSEFHFEHIKPPAPGMEVPAFDYNTLRANPTGGSGTDSTLRPR
ncbi:MAG: hypothetical protein KDI65_10470 [Alphaproteobacteria bacterium]|nr:hypothetical protein [Alphaproteobacteria bacterium]